MNFLPSLFKVPMTMNVQNDLEMRDSDTDTIISTVENAELGQEEDKFWGNLCGADGCIYGIPFRARKVLKFNPISGAIDFIGPDLGSDAWWKWRGGAMDSKGVIYCAPFNSDSVLKIDTNNGDVSELDIELPEYGFGKWASGALALDGCIYFSPYEARYILKFDPENNTLTSVGEDVGACSKFSGTVVGNDGCIYGIPSWSNRIIKFNPRNRVTYFIGGENAVDVDFQCDGNGVVGRNGHIYAAKRNGEILKIDTINNSYSFVGNAVDSDHLGYGWADAILGVDGIIYWPPYNANRTLMFNPETEKSFLVGGDFGNTNFKWSGGAVAPNGAIYCIPCNATKVLVIDPLLEFIVRLKSRIERKPETLGNIFEKNNEGETVYGNAVAKYGENRVFPVIASILPPVLEIHDANNLHPFMVAASCPDASALSMIYYLMRKNPSFQS